MSVIDELKALSKKYDMRPDHFHKDPRGFVIMTPVRGDIALKHTQNAK